MFLTNIGTVLLGKQYNDSLFSCSPSLNSTSQETYKHKWPFGRNRIEDTEMEETVNQSQLGNAKKDEL